METQQNDGPGANRAEPVIKFNDLTPAQQQQVREEIPYVFDPAYGPPLPDETVAVILDEMATGLFSESPRVLRARIEDLEHRMDWLEGRLRATWPK